MSASGSTTLVVVGAGFSAATAVLSAALAIPARPPRVEQLLDRTGHAPAPALHLHGLRSAGTAVAEAVGVTCWRLTGRPIDVERARVLGAAVVAATLTGVVVHPIVGAATGLAVWAWPLLRARRANRAHRRVVVDALPDVVDLLRLAIGSGLTVGHAIDAAAPYAASPFAECFAEVRRRIELGVPTLDALEALRDIGEPTAALHLALLSCERDGAPLRQALEQVAHEARQLRRRAAEERARRLPVQLLFPLVVCVLPSFGLLTVVPLLAGSLRSLAI